MLDDGTGALRLVFFNQPYLARWLVQGKTAFAYGLADLPVRYRRGLVMQNPQVELEEADDGLSVGRIVPIYRKLSGLAPKVRRRLVAKLLDDVADRLPERFDEDARRRLELRPLHGSLREAHFPGLGSEESDAAAWERRTAPALVRLVFEEFLEFQLGMRERRQRLRLARAPVIAADDEVRERLRAVLPFPLTGAQKRVIREIGADLRSGRPMVRLLQGDVGSGKTIVAVLSAILAAERGYQTFLMAPTELLAEQHAGNVYRLLKGTRFTPALLTGRVKGKARALLLDQLAGGRVNVLVGTHALLESPVVAHRLGLVVVDEQHRFGVGQRAAIASKVLDSGERPHLLVMSATPIPRSLAMTLYGDLDVSVLDEKPPGRSPIATRILPEADRGVVFREIAEEVAAGGQAYVVVPLVEESDAIDAKAVEKHADEVRRALPAARIGVVHGRVPAEEREKTMGAFAAGTLDVLVATTVVEVGVDVPNASYLAVENAERFGLAQLHQLRGRVGRGRRVSRCVLLAGEAASAEARERLSVLERTEDGFVVAEEDLKRRGPGDALGTRQSGAPLFRVGDIVRDAALMRRARDTAGGLDDATAKRFLDEPLFFRSGFGAAPD